MIKEALLVAFLTWFVSAAMPMWLRWAFHFGGPIVAGFIYGLVFGDLSYGLQVGANVMLPYMGLVAVGGAVPSDLSIAGYLGVAMTMLAHQPPEVGLTIAVPLATLGTIAQNAKMSLNSFAVHKADKYAKEGNTTGIMVMNVFASQIVPFVLLFIPSFLAVYFGAARLEAFLSTIPQIVIDSLILAGKILPALGLALLLQQLGRKVLIPFFIIGFVASAYLELNIMAISIIGAALAIMHYIYSGNKLAGGQE
ncbi:PTS mannose/fructose/sorbose/N-acetylgalactosamine transporter subunit IIC [Helcococcus sueciensis]|uniref:PTS mannose/fructose/sorbose/N-acetylgalactosamine transporter subunit IIC n=1 Tax=Helcococcus sueciensis TaxID=241555 RepID=UPI000416A0E4|nr:PTS sugar transporter subunit IIC [Helcococcus sueciensis]